jgi:hypothetical protein
MQIQSVQNAETYENIKVEDGKKIKIDIKRNDYITIKINY